MDPPFTTLPQGYPWLVGRNTKEFNIAEQSGSMYKVVSYSSQTIVLL